MNQTQPNYDIAAIRHLLKAAFSDDDLRDLCYDHFREVYDKFAANTPRTDKIHALVEYCERHNKFPILLRLIEQDNPTQYAELASTLQKSASQPQSSNLSTLQPSISPRQPFEPEMILIPAGEFLMESDFDFDRWAETDEWPHHFLYLPDYYLAKTPVTNVQYLVFVRSTDYESPEEWEKGQPPANQGKYPVIHVSWYDAIAYCKWLAEVTGRPYYLPSEAEWEKGARGVNGRIYPWGNEWDAKKCNCVENGSNNITPVDAYPDGASPYGLLDMVGNIYEWTLSLWGTNGKKPDFMYPYRLDDGREDMTANNNIYRILRGGAFIAPSFEHRCAIRLRRLPNDKAMGFRVAMFPF